MKIRSQLVVLVLAAIAPVAILAAITTFQLWQLQRETYEQRFLERVTALRLALDTELDGTIRTLRSLADSADFDPGAGPLQAHAHFERLTSHGPHWITMGLVDAQGDTLVRVDREGTPKGLRLDEATVKSVLSERAPAISNLIAFDDGRVLVTFIAVPVLRKEALNGIVYVGVEHRGWLDFLNHYPIAKRATLTLNDRNGAIITRTLNDEQWAGKRSSSGYWDRTIGRAEGVFQNVGLEGQRFYSAFSRSEQAGWVLGTGVPRDEAEAGLSVPTTLLGLGIATAIVVASLLALFLGRRVADTVTALANYAKSMAKPNRATRSAPLPIVEAETVRMALDEAAVQLDARERSVNEALEREARSRAAAEQANQAKDQFLAMLGHELRNPLSAISAAITVLDMTTRDHDAQTRAREIVRRQLRHLTQIVNDLLDVSRLTIGKVALNRRPLDLGVVVQHVVASFRDSGRCEHLSIEAVLTPVSVIGDETRIEQVVGNLLDNACKYTPAGGHVLVTVEAAGNEAELRVRDDGSGIVADLLPHVFDLFAQGQRTLDRAQGGLGLGLTVVRRLVELHGGSVAVESAGTNRGSTFIVRLPRMETQSALEGPSAVQPALATRRIVLVEDNPDSRDVVSTLLRMKGHDVKIAVDGPTGIEAIDSGAADVALVDIGLPGFDGTEVARRVRGRSGGHDLILIALTGYGTPEDRATALAAGFDAFLVKPFDLAAFEAAVASAERSRRADVDG
jgi:signal transduction histidine kinase/ActR/RegA family two-component response regulator